MADKPGNTEEYLATLTPAQRTELEALRETLRAAAPEAEEGFSYLMPLFRLGDQPLVWYAAWKQHYSLYPMSAAMLQQPGADAYQTAKGTIRFPASKPLPHALVAKLVAARAAELRAGGK